MVAIVLAIVTAAEVAIYYIPALLDYIVPFLLVFSFFKFVLVALYFMHLKFDSAIFKRLFVVGIVLALVVFAVVLVTFFARGGAAPAAGG